MIQIKHLINMLSEFPGDSLCYAYEGESRGIVILDQHHKEIGFIEASEAYYGKP